MPQALLATIEKEKILVNSSVSLYPTFRKYTKHEGVGGTRWWGYGCSLYYLPYSFVHLKLPIIKSRGKELQMSFKRITAEHIYFFSHIYQLLSDFPSSHFHPFISNCQEKMGKKNQSLTMLAYWVGHLTSKTEMFPIVLEKSRLILL